MKNRMSAVLLAGCMTISALPFAGYHATPASAQEIKETTAETSAAAEELSDKVASKAEMAEVENVLEDWMTPIPPQELKEGTYDAAVNCSSSMFVIEKAAVTVEDGSMSATLTMGGTGYLYVYPGTAEEAAKAPEDEYIPYAEDEEGRHTFTIPIEALDAPVPCAAYSKRKEKWYERTLAFVSTSLPADAFAAARGTAAESLGLKDGIWSVEAALSGGSGKASIESPAKLTVEDGKMTLEVIFSSKNYDYMLVDGVKYETVNTEGNSTFLIPVTGFDYQMPVTADTIAMSRPHEIDYTIFLDSATLQPGEQE